MPRHVGWARSPPPSSSPFHWSHMQEIGAFEAKNKLAALLDRVERGEEIVITRHGKAVARLVPNVGGIDQSQARAAVERIRARAQSLKAGRFDWDACKAGRP
jgi:prevent-host-death family protein